MSRRIIVAVVLAVIFAVSLAAVAAVGTGRSADITVTPETHRSGGEGYFRVRVPLPKGAPAGFLILTPRVEKGDMFLVTALAPLQPGQMEDEGEDAATDGAAPVRMITVAGRFGRAGPARLAILARSPGASLKPLVTLSFTLPEGDSDRPDVRKEWARQQQFTLAGADPETDDSFTSYWNGVIAPQYGLSKSMGGDISRFRREPPDLYSVFTGAAAIQESLQLELLGAGPQSPAQRKAIQKAGDLQSDGVPLDTLSGPAVKSHPFREMLKGRNPPLPPLASYIPADQYAVFFSNINKEIELADLMDEWGGNLLRQMETSARDFRVREKVSRQLCLENGLLTRMFGDRVITDMAFTGNDPFLKEGTAFTVLFSLKDRQRFLGRIAKNYDEAVSGRGAISSEFTIEGKRGIAVVSPDRRVSSYTILLGNMAAVSNSKAALERVLAAGDKRLPSLALSDDFRYMRTIFPQDARGEDIFIYFSDPHIRELVGPRWKIGEAHRMRCAGNMALIANARLWFRSEKRREPTMEELVDGGYLGKNLLHCPDHGEYAIDKKGEPFCSIHNRPGLLTPVGEVPLERVTPEEEAQYRAFVENYNRYWTRFFDPIGIRVKMGQTIRVQTCILPLIENSWYDGLVAMSGHRQGSITEDSLLPRTVLSLRSYLSPEWLAKTSPMQKMAEQGRFNLDWLGDEIALNLCDGQVLFTTGGQAMGLLGREAGRSSSLEPLVIGYLVSALNLPTYLTVKVNDTNKAEAAIPLLFNSFGPGHGRGDEFAVETYTIEDHRGKPVYVVNFSLFVVKLRLYAAVVNDRLVIASRRDIVTDLMDAAKKHKGEHVAKHDGNLELSVYRTAFKQIEETVNLGYQEELRHACRKNLPLVAIMLKGLDMPANSITSETLSLRGYEPYCPAGGKYVLDSTTGDVSCTLHGTLYRQRQPATGDQSSPTMKLVNSLKKVNARLTFTPEGLMTTLEIQRKGGNK
jgi:hypothetical protein